MSAEPTAPQTAEPNECTLDGKQEMTIGWCGKHHRPWIRCRMADAEAALATARQEVEESRRVREVMHAQRDCPHHDRLHPDEQRECPPKLRATIAAAKSEADELRRELNDEIETRDRAFGRVDSELQAAIKRAEDYRIILEEERAAFVAKSTELRTTIDKCAAVLSAAAYRG